MNKIIYFKNNHYKYTFYVLGFAYLFLIINCQAVSADISLDAPMVFDMGQDTTNFAEGIGTLVQFGQYLLNGLIGIGLSLSVFGFIKTAFEISSKGARERQEAMGNLITLTITTACLGAFPLFLNLIVVLLSN